MQGSCRVVHHTVGYKLPFLTAPARDFSRLTHHPAEILSTVQLPHSAHFFALFVTLDDQGQNHKSAVYFSLVFAFRSVYVLLPVLPLPILLYPMHLDYVLSKNQTPSAYDTIAAQYRLPFGLLQLIAYLNHTSDPPTVCHATSPSATQSPQLKFRATAPARYPRDNHADVVPPRLNPKKLPHPHDSNKHEYGYQDYPYLHQDALYLGAQNNPQFHL